MPKTEQTGANAKIGASVKLARVSSRLTLAELAAGCGLSESYLSKIERGVTSATIANLLQICASLDIEIASLFGDLGNSSTETSVAVHRGTDKQFSFIPATGYGWRRLGGGRPKDKMEIFHLVLPKSDKMEAFVAHPGQEHCFVISGEVIFDVGDQSHHLRAGDGIYINSHQPHRARSTGNEEAHILMTVAAADGSHPEFDWWRPVGDSADGEKSGSPNGGNNEQIYP